MKNNQIDKKLVLKNKKKFLIKNKKFHKKI